MFHKTFKSSSKWEDFTEYFNKYEFISNPNPPISTFI